MNINYRFCDDELDDEICFKSKKIKSLKHKFNDNEEFNELKHNKKEKTKKLKKSIKEKNSMRDLNDE